MDVSVVVPAYQAARTLAATIASVRAQTGVDVEVVVVDDGSTDDTAGIARAAGARCIQQDNAGPAAARNRGVRESSAPFVAFLDADDAFESDKLAVQLDVLRTTDAVACAADATVVDADDRPLGVKNAARRVPSSIGFADLLDDNPIVCSSVVVRREAIEAAGGFDEDPVLIATEDYDLWLRLTRDGARIAYVDRPLVRYRRAAGSLSDDERFARGVDRALAKVMANDAGRVDARRVARRRAGVRIDLAWQRLQEGDGAGARAALRDARALGGPAVRAVVAAKIWLRSWFARRS